MGELDVNQTIKLSLMLFYFKASFLLVFHGLMLLDTAVEEECLLATHSRDLVTASSFYHYQLESPLTVDQHDHNIQDSTVRVHGRL